MCAVDTKKTTKNGLKWVHYPVYVQWMTKNAFQIDIQSENKKINSGLKFIVAEFYTDFEA